jgi:ketosteroid isomerase-like protein
MSDLDDFLTPTLARQLEAEKAPINGDPGPRLAMWSTQEPVTVFGAEKTVIGSDEARQVFHWLATRFSNLTDYRFELVAAGVSGDLAYTLGYEHITVSMEGGPVALLTLRVTHLYRREDGEWKIVHRHADVPPTGSAPFCRRIDGVGVPALGQGRAGATLGPHPSRASGTTAVSSGQS